MTSHSGRDQGVLWDICAGHRHLLDQFTCNEANNRMDEYGGSIKDRIRLPLEAINEVAKALGAERTAYILSLWKGFQGTLLISFTKSRIIVQRHEHEGAKAKICALHLKGKVPASQLCYSTLWRFWSQDSRHWQREWLYLENTSARYAHCCAWVQQSRLPWKSTGLYLEGIITEDLSEGRAEFGQVACIHIGIHHDGLHRDMRHGHALSMLHH